MKYGAILADPPWRFETWGTQENATTDVERHYATMTIEEICALPVSEWAAKDCALFMWTTWPVLERSFEVIQAWGFTYRTLGFAWVKGEALPLFPDDARATWGTGYWSRSNTEPCLLAARGSPKRKDGGVHQVIFDKRREHSRKPDEIYERIERLVDGPYLEMFARQRRPGWDQFGNEADKFEAAE